MEKIKKIIEIAQELGWSVDDKDTYMIFQKYSNADNDYSFEVDLDGVYGLDEDDIVDLIIRNVCDTYESFDCSEQAYMWLDKSGHGTNGAPYDMKDVYEDMESIEENLRRLYYEVLEEME